MTATEEETTMGGESFERTLEQRLKALKRANEIRSRRAELKREVRSGSVLIVDVLRYPPDYAASAKIHDVLTWAPGMGDVKAHRLLLRARVSPGKTLGGLSPRQRTELASYVETVLRTGATR